MTKNVTFRESLRRITGERWQLHVRAQIQQRAVNPQQIYMYGPHLMDCSLPYELWTHEAQLGTILYVLTLRPDLDASIEVPAYIHAYDASNRIAGIEPRRFHATLTDFYVRVIRYFVDDLGSNASPGRAYKKLLNSSLAQPDFPLQFFSRDYLFSDLAHEKVLEPDIQPVNRSVLQAHMWRACA